MSPGIGMTKETIRRAAVLRELELSGFSMAELCRREELPCSTVAARSGAPRREAGRFIEVESAGVPAMTAAEVLCAELVMPGGAVLRIFTGRVSITSRVTCRLAEFGFAGSNYLEAYRALIYEIVISDTLILGGAA